MINDVELDTVTRYLCNEGVIIFKFKVRSLSVMKVLSYSNSRFDPYYDLLVLEVAIELLVSSLAKLK